MTIPPPAPSNSKRTPPPKKTMPTIETTEAWRDYIVKHWDALKAGATQAKTPYQELVTIAFLPVMPKDAKKLDALLSLIGGLRYTEALVTRLKKIYADKKYTQTATELAKQLNPDGLSQDEVIGLDWVLMVTGSLSGLVTKKKEVKSFIDSLLQSPKDKEQYPSAVRVQAGMISAGQNVIFAGEDVNIITQHYRGDKAQLRTYLTGIRADWAIPATNIHPVSQHHVSTILHRLYTPIDIWIDDPKPGVSSGNPQLNARWHRAIYQNLNEERKPALEAIATHPYIVITGGAGSGKSSLSRYIVTSLAYACDETAEERDGISGLELLGSAWIHGPMLPLYVGLRDFCNWKDFPKSQSKSSGKNLLAYLKLMTGSFANSLESYLTQTDVATHGTLLVLDGLDEVHTEKDRMILSKIIESWANSFPSCRIVITSRSYAYRPDSKWRLSKRFKSVELAPFTWSQMDTYIERWYDYAVHNRPGTFGGHAVAKERAQAMANDLKQTIRNSKTIVPLARHPLMLALLALIHEDYKHLPSKRAQIYAQTVDLLDRWNIPDPSDSLDEKLANLNLDGMRAALKMTAFELQSQKTHYQRYPTSIQRGQLYDKLRAQKETGYGLGENTQIEDVLEYLATRNGILVSESADRYRFPHLSIQEYLAACALIEYYDECPMPSGLKPASGEGWTFPENIVALLRKDHSRWRNVTLFAGSILAASPGWDIMRWQLIDELLPAKIEKVIPDNIVHSICVAAEIWSESLLKARTRSQHAIQDHLVECLKAIKKDERVDIPDSAKNASVLSALSKPSK